MGLKHYRIGDKVRFSGQPGGGDAYYSEDGPQEVVPWIGAAFHAHKRPEAQRMSAKPMEGEGDGNGPSPRGGWMQPKRLREWE